MTETTKGDQLSPLKRAILELREMRAKLAEMERARVEPIAIIGLGCRFPGRADTPEAFWELLREGVDATRVVPPDRWDIDAYYDAGPDAPGKMYTRHGAWVEDVDKFDPQFFGISPREAASMDPQQRLLLEVGWEALERAGYAPERLMSSSTGVFVGISTCDYGFMELQTGGAASIDAYFGTGSAASAAAGRLSYFLGLQGPCLAMDTACSSSLVAVHLACQSLRQGECGMALAGGVNLILRPEVTISFCRARMLSADGHCKTFDASADGYVRGEGCGLVVLKRLSDALAQGDHVLAVIRASAVNQDGRSGGLTVPNGPAQEALIRVALGAAGVAPADVGYVEAHGTGTSLGDPIEMRALGAVMSEGRPPERPLIVGSVKTNVGHLEAAAGVAGLIKVVLSLQHGEIPPHLHFKQPNPHISLAEIPAVVPTTLTPWPDDRSRIAGLSSFGFTGTNAHLVLEQAPPEQLSDSVPGRPLHVLTLSARSERALREIARRFGERLAGEDGLSLADVAFTANTGRARFPERLAVVGGTAAEVVATLNATAAGETPPAVIRGRFVGQDRPEVAFLFTGQGSQYVGMGRHLYETQPTVRHVLDRCDEILRPLLPRPLLTVMYPSEGDAAPIDETQYAQPALFALEYALYELWRSWGIEPSAVMGHSVGEYVAACVAGVFSLEDGLRLVAARGRLMGSLPTHGAMAAVLDNEDRVRRAASSFGAAVSIAAVNGPDSVVVSGEAAAVEELVAAFQSEGVRAQRLAVSHAFHSALMEPVLDEYERVAAEITYAPPRIMLVSNVTGSVAGDELCRAGYWRRHARDAVRFHDGMSALYQQGYRVFLEAGPNPTLLGMARQCVPNGDVAWIPSLRRGRDEWREVLGGVATLFTRGVEVDWTRLEGGHRRRVTLPTYPFERERYWAEAARVQPPSSTPRREADEHPLLGRRLRSPLVAGVVFEADLGLASLPFLGEHRVHGTVVVPAATYVEMALAAARESRGGDWSLEDLVIEEPLVLPEEESRAAQIILAPRDEAMAFQVVSAGQATDGREPVWIRHATGKLGASRPAGPVPSSASVSDIKARCPLEVSARTYYDGLRERGFALGPRFQAISGVWCGAGEALGELRLPSALAADASSYRVHPVLFDACCHVAGAVFPPDANGATYLVLGFRRFELLGPIGAHVWSHATLPPDNGEGDEETRTASVRLLDEAGRVVATVEGLQFKRARPEALGRVARESLAEWLYEVAWQPKTGDGARDGAPADYLLAPDRIAQQVAPEIAPLAAEHGLAHYVDWLPQVDALGTAYVLKAFRQLGGELRLGRRMSVPAMASELRVADRHRRLLGRMLGMLAEDGILRAVDGEWEVARVPPPDDAEARYAELRASFPMAASETSLAGRCGEQLAAVLRGEADPLPLLFPGGSPAAAEQIYQDSPGARTFNGVMQKAIVAAIGRLPRGRTLRVLEVGAGTGGTTASILPILPSDSTRYVFTDVSPAFTQRAADRFQAYPFVRYQLLDVEKDPETQGFGAHQFDLILAVNVLHATRDLRETLSHLQRLLAPEGLLAIMEATRPMRWLDLTFGLTDGWWRFEDLDLRPAHPLLSARQWIELLSTTGFTGAVALPEAGEQGDSLSAQALVLARAPRRDAPRESVPRTPRTADAAVGDWLILADAGGTGEQVAERIRANGGRCALVQPGDAYTANGDRTWCVRPGRPDDFHRVLVEARPPGATAWRGILHLWSLDAPANDAMTPAQLESAQVLGCGGLLHLVQAVMGGAPSPIWVVTRGAQPVDGSASAAPAVAQSPVWGLGRVVALEHPELWGGLVDLDPGDTDGAARILEHIDASDGEDQVAFRGDVRYVARLVRSRSLKMEPARLRPDGAYLVSGGLGRLGPKVARWLAEEGARHIVLTGRKGLGDRAAWAGFAKESEAAQQADTVKAIEALGATVDVVAADASDASQMAALLGQFGRGRPSLRGVIHVAASPGTASLRDMSLEALSTVLRPKVTGSWVMSRLTDAMDLDFFVLFSSTTGLLGARELAHYAAANTFLDALSHYRRAAGKPAVSINWGLWQEIRAGSAEQARTVAGAGLRGMPSARALKALGHLLHSDVPQVVVAAVDWATLKAVYESKRRRPFLEEVGAAPTIRSAAAPPERSDILQRLGAARGQDRWDLLVDHVRSEVARVLRLEAGRKVELHRGLFDLGLDSLMSVELKSRLEASLGRTLPATLTFNYPNVGALAGYLAKEVLSLEMPAPALPSAGSDSNEPPGAQDLSEDQLAVQLAEKLADLR